MEKRFKSVYRFHFVDFIKLKHNLGYEYKQEASYLLRIDKLAFSNGETSPGLSEELAQKWIQSNPAEAPMYHYSRIRIFREFSLYLTIQGIKSFLPKLPRYPRRTFVPHIFTHEQIAKVFSASELLRTSIFNPNSPIAAIPSFIRLLYSTGIRISEGIKLKNRDVNLDEGRIVIKDCKNGAPRNIQIHPSLVTVLRQYARFRDFHYLKSPKDFFFTNANGNKLLHVPTQKWFRKCLQVAGIPYLGKKGPRVHDLRHTFAVHSLAKMTMETGNIGAPILRLSKYMGHRNLKSTEYYLRMTEDAFPGLIKKIETISSDIFPRIQST